MEMNSSNDILDELLRQYAAQGDALGDGDFSKTAEEVFSQEPIIEPSIIKKQQLIANLGKSTGISSGGWLSGAAKWWLFSSIIVTGGIGGYLLTDTDGSDNTIEINQVNEIVIDQEIQNVPKLVLNENPTSSQTQEIIENKSSLNIVQIEEFESKSVENTIIKTETIEQTYKSELKAKEFENLESDNDFAPPLPGKKEKTLPKEWQSKYIRLIGKVYDRAYKTDISFADIKIKGKLAKSVSRSNGTFDFKVPTAYYYDTLVVSALGYHNFEIPLYKLNDAYAISAALVIKNKELAKKFSNREVENVYSIIQNMVSRFKSDFVTSSSTNGFYRELRQENGKYVRLIEADVDIIQGKLLTSNWTKINEFRKSVDKSMNKPNFGNCLQSLFSETLTWMDRIFFKNNIYKFEFELEGTKMFEKADVYVVSFELINRKQFENMKGKMLINMENHDLLKLDFLFTDNTKSWYNKDLVNTSIKFKHANNQLLISNINSHSQIYGQNTGMPESYQYDNYSEFISIGVKVKKKRLARLNNQVTESRVDLYEQLVGRYNRSFWNNYSLVESHPIKYKVRSDIEKGFSKLETQFSGDER